MVEAFRRFDFARAIRDCVTVSGEVCARHDYKWRHSFGLRPVIINQFKKTLLVVSRVLKESEPNGRSFLQSGLYLIPYDRLTGSLLAALVRRDCVYWSEDNLNCDDFTLEPEVCDGRPGGREADHSLAALPAVTDALSRLCHGHRFILTDSESDFSIEEFLPWLGSLLDHLPGDLRWLLSCSFGYYEAPGDDSLAIEHGLRKQGGRARELASRQPDISRLAATIQEYMRNSAAPGGIDPQTLREPDSDWRTALAEWNSVRRDVDNVKARASVCPVRPPPEDQPPAYVDPLAKTAETAKESIAAAPNKPAQAGGTSYETPPPYLKAKYDLATETPPGGGPVTEAAADEDLRPRQDDTPLDTKRVSEQDNPFKLQPGHLRDGITEDTTKSAVPPPNKMLINKYLFWIIVSLDAILVFTAATLGVIFNGERQQVEKLRRSDTGWLRENARLKDQNLNLQSETGELKARESRLSGITNNLHQNNISLRDRCSTLEAMEREMAFTNGVFQNQIIALSSITNALHKTNELLTNILVKCNNTINYLNNTNATLSAEKSDIENRYRTLMSNYNNANSVLNALSVSNQNVSSALSEANERLKEFEPLKAKKENLRKEIETLQQEKGKLENDLKEALSANTGKKQRLAGEIKDLEKEKVSLNKEVEALKKKKAPK